MEFEQIVRILSDYKEIDPEEIRPETTFEELELDSLDTVELLMRIEDELGVVLEMDEAMKTVKDLAEAIEAQKENDNA